MSDVTRILQRVEQCCILPAALWFNGSVKPVNKDQRKLAGIIQLLGTDMVDGSGLFDRTRHSGWNRFNRSCRRLQAFRN